MISLTMNLENGQLPRTFSLVSGGLPRIQKKEPFSLADLVCDFIPQRFIFYGPVQRTRLFCSAEVTLPSLDILPDIMGNPKSS